MIVMNCEHGPRHEEGTYAQLSESWNELRAHFNAKTCAVFQNHCADMIEEYGDITEELEECDGGDVEQAMWRLWAKDNVAGTLGRRQTRAASGTPSARRGGSSPTGLTRWPSMSTVVWRLAC